MATTCDDCGKDVRRRKRCWHCGQFGMPALLIDLGDGWGAACAIAALVLVVLAAWLAHEIRRSIR